jgi:hypothetical protein
VDNRSYWDAQAADCDSLYTTSWCKREEDRIRDGLHKLCLPNSPVALDIPPAAGGLPHLAWHQCGSEPHPDRLGL